MDRISILELYRTARNENKPLFGDPEDLATYDFMSAYLVKFNRLDRNFAKTHAHWCPLWNLNYESDKNGVYNAFREDVTDLIEKNSNEYQRLWDALVEASYDPIENYDKYDEIISNFGATRRTDNIGAGRRATAYGAQSRTNQYGAQSSSTNFGAVSTTLTKGSQIDSESIGQRQDSSTHYMQGFNSTNPNETNSDAASTGAQLNSKTSGARSDSESTAAHSDSQSIGQHSDTISEQAHTDTLTEDARVNTSAEDARQDKVEQHTHGNIGVTSAMDLINQEVALRIGTRFYDIIFNDIIKELCQLVDDCSVGALSICLNRKPKALREIASYGEFTMYVDENSGLYVVYEAGQVVPSFRYDEATGNLYIIDRAGFEIHLRYDAESGNLYREEEV